ncbi:MAG: DoxX family protein [bacterium]|nr:MAG: DoxX family protein [bacterium]
MLRRLISTDDDVAGLVLRITLGAVMWPHGAQKLVGWFGGGGFNSTLTAFQDHMGIPAAVTILVIISEFFGSIGLITGTITRFCAFGTLCVMIGAIFMVHLPNGFFMNWSGQQSGEGFEFHLLAVAMAAALMIKGGGRWSVDAWLADRF